MCGKRSAMAGQFIDTINKIRSRSTIFGTFACAYFAGGLLAVLLFWLLMGGAVARFVTVNWIALGVAVALIAYGLPRKETNPRAGLAYYLGIGWLLLLLIGGLLLLGNQGIGVDELGWLME